MSITHNTALSTTYYPPSPEVLDHFAFAVCEELGADFAHPEVARGLADFLTTVAQIQANNLNRKGNNEFTLRVE